MITSALSNGLSEIVFERYEKFNYWEALVLSNEKKNVLYFISNFETIFFLIKFRINYLFLLKMEKRKKYDIPVH